EQPGDPDHPHPRPGRPARRERLAASRPGRHPGRGHRRLTAGRRGPPRAPLPRRAPGGGRMTRRTLWQLAVLLLPIETAALLAAPPGAAAGTGTPTAATLLTLAALAPLARRIASVRAADRAALQDRRRARARKGVSR